MHKLSKFSKPFQQNSNGHPFIDARTRIERAGGYRQRGRPTKLKTTKSKLHRIKKIRNLIDEAENHIKIANSHYEKAEDWNNYIEQLQREIKKRRYKEKRHRLKYDEHVKCAHEVVEKLEDYQKKG